MSDDFDRGTPESIESLFKALYDAIDDVEARCFAEVEICKCATDRYNHLRYHVGEALNKIDFGNYAGARDSLREGLKTPKEFEFQGCA